MTPLLPISPSKDRRNFSYRLKPQIGQIMNNLCPKTKLKSFESTKVKASRKKKVGEWMNAVID